MEDEKGTKLNRNEAVKRNWNSDKYQQWEKEIFTGMVQSTNTKSEEQEPLLEMKGRKKEGEGGKDKGRLNGMY